MSFLAFVDYFEGKLYLLDDSVKVVLDGLLKCVDGTDIN